MLQSMQLRIKELYPRTTYDICVEHTLELVTSAGASSSVDSVDLFSLKQLLNTFFSFFYRWSFIMTFTTGFMCWLFALSMTPLSINCFISAPVSIRTLMV